MGGFRESLAYDHTPPDGTPSSVESLFVRRDGNTKTLRIGSSSLQVRA